MGKKRNWLLRGSLITMVLALGATVAWPNPTKTEAALGVSASATAEDEMLVTLLVPDRQAVDQLIAAGYDVEHRVKDTAAGVEVDLVATPSQLAELEQRGYKRLHTIFTREQWNQRLAERNAVVQKEQNAIQSVDEINVLRAHYFTNETGSFLYIEAKTNAGYSPAHAMKATWAGGSATLAPFVDEGVYMYHYLLVPVTERPNTVTLDSTLGGTATVDVTDWLGDGKPPKPDKHYVSDFVTHYMNPTEVTERIEALAAEYPEIAEIVALPNKTNGYRRHATATHGSGSNGIVVNSKAWGHEGGNDLRVEIVKPDAANAPLTVTTAGSAITVSLATNSSGASASTAAQVATALNDQAGAVVAATTLRGATGTGVVQPGTLQLTDGLNAPPEISRDPFEVKAIRIGKHRDGSRLGVLAYSQEHAREWVTPLVAVETAERLLRNYAHDGETRKLVDNLDIFIIPTVNPDGGHYSFFDYNMQRKNMTNFCGPEASDAGRKNTWGVDVNRNYRVGSVFDGYVGASTVCTNTTYAGPSELSEPESQNVVWTAEHFTNIKFAMNVHSYGGYFMWPPGAYKAHGRETLPSPTAGEEAFFWSASERILDAIKDDRGTVILPGSTGPVTDVLYSAAGNSADDLWYNRKIYGWDFEVGADLWDAETQSWKAVGFQPPFEEGHQEALEFSDGLLALLKVAYDYDKDRQPPKTKLVPGQGKFRGPQEMTFETSEPATIYYTLDGSKPTLNSPTLQLAGIREEAEKLTVSASATVRWFSVDASGNQEHEKQAKITITN